MHAVDPDSVFPAVPEGFVTRREQFALRDKLLENAHEAAPGGGKCAKKRKGGKKAGKGRKRGMNAGFKRGQSKSKLRKLNRMASRSSSWRDAQPYEPELEEDDEQMDKAPKVAKPAAKAKAKGAPKAKAKGAPKAKAKGAPKAGAKAAPKAKRGAKKVAMSPEPADAEVARGEGAAKAKAVKPKTKAKAKARARVDEDLENFRNTRQQGANLELVEPVPYEQDVVKEIRNVLTLCEMEGHGPNTGKPNVVQQFPPQAPVRLCVYWKKSAVGLKVLGRGSDGMQKWSQPAYFGARTPCICSNIYVAQQLVPSLLLHLLCCFLYMVVIFYKNM